MGVEGSGFGVEGLGFRIEGLGLRGSGFGVDGSVVDTFGTGADAPLVCGTEVTGLGPPGLLPLLALLVKNPHIRRDETRFSARAFGSNWYRVFWVLGLGFRV